ncbi:MAG: TIGR03905 family TSCPD domain-containing protein [Eubacteriales bacterium]|nr:TIGR03905 family TSCPD domain-containing protein [Eubacteriales bacterium]
MEKLFTYKTRGVCSSAIDIVLDEHAVIQSVRFHGGCSGNTQGVARLVSGMPAAEAIQRLRGIRCGFKQTSCPDQLAQALQSMLQTQLEE